MPSFAHVYTDQQREALATTYEDRGVRPARRVAELAAAGELTLDGDKLAPFATTENTVRDCARKLRNRRAGELKSSLATLPPRDAVEVLRRRLISLADRELSVLEHSRRGKVQIERLRQIVRVVREASALPGPDDPRPAQPGQRKPGTGEHEGGRTSGGMAAAILGAASQSARVETHETRPALDPIPTTSDVGPDTHGTHAHAPSTEQQGTDAPGAWARERVGASPL
jgi:hypothetical protein